MRDQPLDLPLAAVAHLVMIPVGVARVCVERLEPSVAGDVVPLRALSAECAGEIVRVSWYGAESGNRTASGKRFDGSQMMAAHRSLPSGTKVRFSYAGRSVTVPIEDRGPYVGGRSYDLSRAAASRLGIIRAGVATVCAERL